MGAIKLLKETTYLYNNCSDLPIWNFDVIYKTNDFKYLVVGYSGYGEVKIPKGANERWQAIKKEWIKLIDNNTISYYYQLVLEVSYLQSRYDVSKMLLYQIYIREMDDETLDKYIKALLEWKYKYNKKNSRFKEIERLMQQHKSSSNKLGLKIDELKGMISENENQDISSLDKQAVILEQITGKNNIDTKTTSVSKWIEIHKLADGINEQRRKNATK